MKKHLTTLLLIFVFFAGLSLMLYPSVSDYWNSLHQSQAMASYVEAVAAIDDDEYLHLWDDAREYNEELPSRTNRYLFSDKDRKRYMSLLRVSNSDVMAYIEIPDIKVSLPVYHGVGEAVLQVAVGHIEGSSLPVGGENTHCALSAHRGLPSAKLFSNLDKLKEGDLFMLFVLREILTYEVDQIRIVLPHETQDLEIEPGRDYFTLVTCTPYGVNSHRLLVRGRRIENQSTAAALRVTADALQIEPIIVAPMVAAPILLALLLLLLTGRPADNKKRSGASGTQKER